MNPAELIIQMLEEHGVKYLFGIPGGAIEDLNIAVYNSTGIQPIITKHEEGAAFIADGYARVSGELGVCCSTAGPGATNLITGLATSYADQIPVLALTGQVATSVFGKGAIQESGSDGINIVSIFRNFTRYSGMLLNEKRTPQIVQKAIQKALANPGGPVHLNLPADIMKKPVGTTHAAPTLFDAAAFAPEAIRTAAEILARAKKPAIIAGWGTVLSRAAGELLRLAELLHIPVATSPKGKGVFPESHPLSLRGIGFAGSRIAREYVIENDVDVLLAVGTSFNEMMSSGWDEKMLPVNHLIHIDANPEMIGRNYKTSIGLVGDAGKALGELTDCIRKDFAHELGEIESRGTFVEDDVAQIYAKHAAEENEPPANADLYHPRELVKDIQRLFPSDTIYFTDIGNVMAWAIRYLVMDTPYSFFVSLGFGGMGYAAAAPVGAQLAAPNRPVVSLVGDGSFLMNGVEIATAVNYKLPAIWIVFNNAMLGLVHHGRKLFREPIPEGLPSDFERVDFAKVAEGLGARGITIDTPGALTEELVGDILAQGRPTLLDVRIDEAAVPPIHSRIKTVDKHFEG